MRTSAIYGRSTNRGRRLGAVLFRFAPSTTASATSGKGAAGAADAPKCIRRSRMRRILRVAAFGLLLSLGIAQWLPQPASSAASPTTTPSAGLPLSLESFDFSNPTSGFGVFTSESPSGKSCSDLVGTSTDGGAIFKSLATAMTWNCANSDFSSTLTTDSYGDVFLYGPQLFVSHDDAKTWAKSPQPGLVLDVKAIGRSIWIVVSTCTSVETVANKPCPVHLRESSDGGRTWGSSIESPKGNSGGTAYGAHGQTYLIRVSRSSAYLMMAPPFNTSGGPSVVPLWFTSDGGHSWSGRRVPCHIAALSAVLAVAPDGTLMAVCASGPSAGGQRKSVLESNDGGRTWDLKTGSNIDNGYLGAVDLVTSREAFLVGARSSLLVTHDGGANWKPVQPLIGGSDGGTSEVRFFNIDRGIVLGNDQYNDEKLTLWSTTDGGKHWSSIVSRVDSSVHTVNAKTALQSTPIPLLLTGVAGTPFTFVVNAKGEDCASSGCFNLQRTSDNGANFTTLHLPPISSAKGSSLGNLSQLIFANSMDGYASLDEANSFAWYATTDGAQSWHRVSVAPGESLLQLAPTHHELYAVIAQCTKKYTCTDYRIARSPLTANKWIIESLPNPLSKGDFALGVYDSNVWANLQGPRVPLLFTSDDEGRTFIQLSASPLASVSGCNLTPTSSTSLWAECPTGMLVSFFHSSDAGVHWSSISRYEYAGTGGGAFDPVSSSLAYLNFGPYTTRVKDLYAITNSGHKMTAVGNLACTSNNYLVFSDADHGLAICQKNGTVTSTYLLRTSDGGRDWTKVNLS